MIKTTLKKFISIFLVVAILLFVIHLCVVVFVVEDQRYLGIWWLNYVFLLPMTIIGLSFVVMKYGKTRKITSIGKNYIFYTVIKMIGALVFLLPWLLYKDET